MTQTAPARLADLPIIAQMEALPFQEVRFTLGSGRVVLLNLEAAPRLLLCPLPTQAGAVLLEDWQDANAPAYQVPADLQHPLRTALHLFRVDT